MGVYGAGNDLGIRDELFRDLEPGEQIIWSSRPNPKAFARAGCGIFVFAIPWTAFAVFWTVTASGMTFWGPNSGLGSFNLFGLFGLPFVLIGFAMLSSPVWLRRKAGRSIYAVTDRRALVKMARLFGGVELQSFYPERLTAMSRTEYRDGSGDLVFEQFTTRNGSGTTTVKRGFIGVPNVREVEATIQKTLLKNRVRAV